MGRYGSDEVECFCLCPYDRKALAAYIKPKVVLVCANIRNACDNPIQEFLEGLKADIQTGQRLTVFRELETPLHVHFHCYQT
jgi:hypothetical protein